MRKFFSIVLSIGLVMISMAQPASANETFTSRFKGVNAYADFQSFDGGCIISSASIFLFQSWDKSEPGVPNEGPGVYISNISRYNQCTNSFELNGSGSGVPDVYFFGKSIASVNTNLWVHDDVSDSYISIRLDLTWTSFGIMTNSISLSRTVYPDGTRSTFRSVGTIQDSDVVGSISDGANEYASAYIYAVLNKTSLGFIILTK